MLVRLMVFLLTVSGSVSAETVTLEAGQDRPGSDYRNFKMRLADPESCRKSCTDDKRCLAYTYVKPGVQGSNARCYLKNRVPKAFNNRCCTSGVKISSSAKLGQSSKQLPGEQPPGRRVTTAKIKPITGVLPTGYIELQTGFGDMARFAKSISIDKKQTLQFRVKANRDIHAGWEIHWMQERSSQRLRSGDLGFIRQGAVRYFAADVPPVPMNPASLTMRLVTGAGSGLDNYSDIGQYVTITYGKAAAEAAPPTEQVPAPEDYLARLQQDIMEALDPQFTAQEVLQEDCGEHLVAISGSPYVDSPPKPVAQSGYLAIKRGQSKRVLVHDMLINFNDSYYDSPGLIRWRCGSGFGNMEQEESECDDVDSGSDLDAVTITRPASGDDFSIICEKFDRMNSPPDYYPSQIFELSCDASTAFATAVVSGKNTEAISRGEKSSWIEAHSTTKVEISCGGFESGGFTKLPSKECRFRDTTYAPHIRIERFQGSDALYLLCGHGKTTSGLFPSPGTWPGYYQNKWAE